MDRIERHRTRFTLIELLAVVALLSMLMAIGIPAFARMIRGSKVDESARNIKLALEQAQMRAASERCYVAVIFPSGSDTDVDSTLRPYRLGGFRTAYVKKRGNGVYEFSKWLDPDWRNAPGGAILTKVGTTAANFSSSEHYIDGCTAKSTDALKGSGALKKLTEVKNDKGESLKVGENCALIFTPYGGAVCTSKLYLLVSEALVEGEAITYPAAKTGDATSTSNYRVLKVNNLTGRVEFYE